MTPPIHQGDRHSAEPIRKRCPCDLVGDSPEGCNRKLVCERCKRWRRNILFRGAGSSSPRRHSYNKRDASRALELASQIGKLGFEVWMDVHRLGEIDDWQTPVRAAIAESQALIAIVTEHYFGSARCLLELELAHSKEQTVVAVILGEPADWNEHRALFDVIVDLTDEADAGRIGMALDL